MYCLSLNGSSELLHSEPVLLEVLVDGLEKSLGHVGLSIEDPEVFVVGAANDRVGVVLVQSHNPVVGFNVQGGGEFDLQLGVGVLLVFGIGEGLADGLMLNSVAVADVVDSDGSIGVERVGGDSLLAVPLEVVGDDCLFVPGAQVLGHIDVGDSLGGIQGEAGGFHLHVGQLPSKKSEDDGDEDECCSAHILFMLWVDSVQTYNLGTKNDRKNGQSGPPKIINQISSCRLGFEVGPKAVYSLNKNQISTIVMKRKLCTCPQQAISLR